MTVVYRVTQHAVMIFTLGCQLTGLWRVSVRSVINCGASQIVTCPVPSKFRHHGHQTLCHSGLLAGGDNLDIKGREYLDILQAEKTSDTIWLLDTKLGMRPGGINH